MSEENSQPINNASAVASFSGGTYDYLKNETKPEPKPDGEDPNAPKEQPGEKKAPWEVPEDKKKDQTPPWARKRFHEFSQKVSAAEERATKAEKMLEAITKGFAPEDGEVKMDKFKREDGSYDIEAFTKELTTKTIDKAKQDWLKELEEKQKQELSKKELDAIAEKNYEETKKVIPNLDENLSLINPELALESSVVEHLQKSPVGYKTLSRIGGDEALQKQLMGMDVKQRTSVIAEIHDEILNYEIAQMQQQKQEPQGTAPQPKPAKPIPAPPPKQRGSGDLGSPSLEMTGDEWIRSQNSRPKRR